MEELLLSFNIDDIIVTDEFVENIIRLMDVLAKEFEIKDLKKSEVLTRFGNSSLKERNFGISKVSMSWIY